MFAVVVLLWLRIIYLPARTMERWEGQRPGCGEKREGSETRQACQKALRR